MVSTQIYLTEQELSALTSMASPLLLDTDVLTDYLRVQADAVAFLGKTRRPLLVSAVTVAELHVGVREGAERQALDRFLGLMDALIAASAEMSGCVLATLDEKHFPMLESVLVPYRKT